ncbi:MAG: hypothetical protein L0Y58_06545 [Verrucomicrobia subdivision 3 bacterium]|nr:hypothetical protein [Limisphaerales bacterium]
MNYNARRNSLLVLVFGIATSQAATLTVTNVKDGEPGSLRQAILDANATPAVDIIAFNIPGAGDVFTNSVHVGGATNRARYYRVRLVR